MLLAELRRERAVKNPGPSAKPKSDPLSLIPSGLRDFDGAAAFLGTTPRHVRRLWQERRLAGIKVGKAVRFSEADLHAFVERHRVEAVR
jgi:excisionase family DNA binding protein